MCNLRQYYICYENITLQKYVQNAVKLHIVTTVYIKGEQNFQVWKVEPVCLSALNQISFSNRRCHLLLQKQLQKSKIKLPFISLDLRPN